MLGQVGRVQAGRSRTRRAAATSGAPADRRRGRLVGPLLAVAVLVIGLTVVLRAVTELRADQRDAGARVMDQRTAVAGAAVAAETERYMSLLTTVAAGLGSNVDFTGTDFAAASGPLANAGLTGATSVAYVVAASHGQLARTQAYWRSRGADGLVLKESPGPQEHFFSIFIRTLNGHSPRPPGGDLAASAEASEALGEARRTGQAAVSDTYVLLRDRTLPFAQQQLSFMFAAPVYAHALRPGFAGWLVLGVRGQDFFGGVLRTASQGQLGGELVATDEDGQQVTVAASNGPGRPQLVREVAVPVANREWTLVTRADPEYLPGVHTHLPSIVLLGGMALTGILAWLVFALAGGRFRARWQVAAATAELRTAERESRSQAALLSAIMDSLGDGVGVVDENGAFLLHNPAAKALLGVTDDVDGPANWQEHYGLFRPDGVTPFPVEELPLVRALRGEPSDGVEMVVRNPGRPDGLLLSVDGRPLDLSGGRRGAVAVFHDITELRRYETDLRVFAGVVAHDLKAPLAIVRGYCEAAADELSAAPGGPEVGGARAAVDRIAAGVDRMAGLIDTLLAYTTSRDAPLRPVPLALGPLVTEVVQYRTSALRPGDGPAPQVYVGPLPDVCADPAMLRHVVDNLIGNALKYVQPGRAARVDVTAAPAPPGYVRIEVSDRGIGIPDADKPSIFESFHRAHTAAGYAGTGLGLAICRRIVERHGGTIGVADNPGGGTRFHVTLPAAESRPGLEPVPEAAPEVMAEPSGAR